MLRERGAVLNEGRRIMLADVAHKQEDAARAAATTALASFAPVDVRLRVFGIAGATPGPGPRVAAAEVTVVNG